MEFSIKALSTTWCINTLWAVTLKSKIRHTYEFSRKFRRYTETSNGRSV